MNTIQLPEWTITTLALGIFLIVVSSAAAGIVKGSIMVTVLWTIGGLVLGVAIGWVAGVRVERYRGKRRRERRVASIQEAGARLFRAMTAPPEPGEFRGCLGCDGWLRFDGQAWWHMPQLGIGEAGHTPRPSSRRPPAGAVYSTEGENVAVWDVTSS